MGLSFEGFLVLNILYATFLYKNSCNDTEIWNMPQICTFVSQNYHMT